MPILQRTGLWYPGLVIGAITAAAVRILDPSPWLVLFVLLLTAADIRARAAAGQTGMRDRLRDRIVVLPIWGLDPEGSGSRAA